MPAANRDVLSVLYSALMFGTILSPYGYITGGALSYFAPSVALIIISWLVTSTALLLLVFVSKTKLEERLATKVGRYWQPTITLAVIAALASTYFVESKIANFTLLESVEYWYYLTLITEAATALALGVIVATIPSRLEKSLAFLFSPRNRFHVFCRAVGFLVLLVVVIVAGYKLYEYYLYKQSRAYRLLIDHADIR